MLFFLQMCHCLTEVTGPDHCPGGLSSGRAKLRTLTLEAVSVQNRNLCLRPSQPNQYGGMCQPQHSGTLHYSKMTEKGMESHFNTSIIHEIKHFLFINFKILTVQKIYCLLIFQNFNLFTNKFSVSYVSHRFKDLDWQFSASHLSYTFKNLGFPCHCLICLF